MSVQEQIPYQSFTANGETTDFYINFHHEGAENIVVRVNGENTSASMPYQRTHHEQLRRLPHLARQWRCGRLH